MSGFVTFSLRVFNTIAQVLAVQELFTGARVLLSGRAVHDFTMPLSMIRLAGCLPVAVVSLAVGWMSGAAAAPAVSSGADEPRPAPAAAAASAGTPGAEVVPGTSATIRLLLDLQNQQPPADADNTARAPRAAGVPARPASQPARDLIGTELPQTDAQPATSDDNGSGSGVSWSTSPGGASADPAAMSAAKAEARPSRLRAMVSYLREHRLQVFVGGLVILALAAIGTIVSARRQRATRAGRRLTGNRSPAARPRRPDAARSH
jgi:hypothetical protein